MIDRLELRNLARARIRDAEVLYRAKRYHGAIYICGYGVELALKARICQTLRWSDYPDTGPGAHGLGNLKTHNFDLLLRLSGIEARVNAIAFQAWSTLGTWTPDVRYAPLTAATEPDARNLIDAAKVLLRILAP